jgi:hypothetical protein
MNALPETNRIGNVVNGITVHNYPFNSYVREPNNTNIGNGFLQTNFIKKLNFTSNSDITLGYLYLYPAGSIWTINYVFEFGNSNINWSIYKPLQNANVRVKNLSNSAFPTYISGRPVLNFQGLSVNLGITINSSGNISHYYGNSVTVVVGNNTPLIASNIIDATTSSNVPGQGSILNADNNIIAGISNIRYNYTLEISSPYMYLDIANRINNGAIIYNVTFYAVRHA